jgi:alanine dehydrogenase
MPGAVERLAVSFPGYPVVACSLAEAVDCDIVCMVTPARGSVVKKEWIRQGTHINAIGADAEGKEELEPEILKKAVLVVDDLKQASLTGEINVSAMAKKMSVSLVLGERSGGNAI